MAHKVITPPTTEPISLAEAKAWCRIDGDAQDSIVSILISFARDWAETFTGQAFAEQTWEMAQDYFPCGAIELEGNVASVTSLKYVDEDGVEQTMDSSLYTLDTYSTPNWLLPAVDTDWPTTYATANAMKVRYVVGATPVPAVKAALLLLISHLNENREAVVTGLTVEQLPLGVMSLLSPHRVEMGV